MYVWMRGEETSYLVNLSTFEAVPYNMDPAIDFNWSSDSKFAWLWSSSGSSDANLPSPIHLLSISNKRIEPLNLDLSFDSFPSWHPTNNVLAYISEDAQKLEILNVQSISNQELTLPSTFRNWIWSPSGESIALAAKDGSLWQVDYPKLENLEQLTPSLPDVHSLNWSPDGNSLAFVSATDIYIVDKVK